MSGKAVRGTGAFMDQYDQHIMKNLFPRYMPIDINHKSVWWYHCLSAMLFWFMLFTGIFGVLLIVGFLEDSKHVYAVFLCYVYSLLTVFVLIGLYMVLCVGFAPLHELSVEGAFLRIKRIAIEGSDRKIHFNALQDYAVVDNPLQRLLNIHCLKITCVSGEQIYIEGVIDCVGVRDDLCDLYDQRENETE